LQDVRVDPESGLHIGTIVIDEQLLRVGIRPARRTRADRAAAIPLLIFNGVGANLELAGLLMSELDATETLIFDVPGTGQSPPPSSTAASFAAMPTRSICSRAMRQAVIRAAIATSCSRSSAGRACLGSGASPIRPS